MFKRWVLCAAFAVAWVFVPAIAHGQGFVDVTLGSASGGPIDDKATTFGGAVGVFGARFGVEADYGFSGNIQAHPDLPAGVPTGSHVHMRTISADLLGGPKVGPDGNWRPYGAVGVGLIGGVMQFSDIFSTTGGGQNDIGINFGGGVLGFVYNRIGLRVDLRYFRDLRASHVLTGIKPGFVRFGAGVALKF